ncbi:hypothetical protein M427DRAFT_73176 [Gonapodya prolifera JEL478]|uniref:Spherulation-specific family 4 n=1 Tax=Gonapodya prolifera (strain JEL478) TaxID=1344416 RepID=A0A139A356_GONPJ|nr:hypothetical protein M427DRAFT_73176 [Gonapodya prolifera JEL478]|eukprot:KXS11222.1 hypothetical protein M427DRAFT_73176 [Gonapodya prolifera JEL478]
MEMQSSLDVPHWRSVDRGFPYPEPPASFRDADHAPVLNFRDRRRNNHRMLRNVAFALMMLAIVGSAIALGVVVSRNKAAAGSQASQPSGNQDAVAVAAQAATMEVQPRTYSTAGSATVGSYSERYSPTLAAPGATRTTESSTAGDTASTVVVSSAPTPGVATPVSQVPSSSSPATPAPPTSPQPPPPATPPPPPPSPPPPPPTPPPSPPSPPPPPPSSGTSSTSLLVPLYMYPDGNSWPGLVAAKQGHPSVPIVAIFNPSNGAGSSRDPTIASAVANLKSAGITVLGYTYTQRGTRSASAVQTDIANYAAWYAPIDGIFFDEMAEQSGYEGYYSQLSAAARSTGMWLTIGNVGLGGQQSYVGTLSSMVVYEGANLPSPSGLPGWTSNAAKSNLGVISYGVGGLDASAVRNLAGRVGYLYVTPNGGGNPWSSLPSYIDSLLDALTGV